MTSKATGTFSVTMTPVAWSEVQSDPALNRFQLTKEFHGDLEAASLGQMLTAGSVQAGSAGYVAIEKVTGTLDGRSGSFVLQHNGFMNRGVPNLAIAVVPDSGTGELEGLSGTMSIQVAEGKHSYAFEYSLSTLQ